MTADRIIQDHFHREVARGPFPAALDAVLSAPMAQSAEDEIVSWPGYTPSPLVRLDRLERELGLGGLYYKDEGQRFGLGSFKALGGAYAVLCLAADHLAAKTGTRPALADIRNGHHRSALRSLTVVTATDGNHGRSVAWGAQMAGCACRIYVHAAVSLGRQKAMEALGATVIRVDGDYDYSVRACDTDATDNGWLIVSDTSYEGYTLAPGLVMAGYSVIATEALQQMTDGPPTHVFVQAGVGALAAALAARFWHHLGAARPRIVVVEPTHAGCVLESARQDRPMLVTVTQESVMAGLSCGEVSLLAWDLLAEGADDFITISDDQVGPVMRRLASGDAGGRAITAGESAVSGLIGVIGGTQTPDMAQALGLDERSRVLVLGSEGATDPTIYRRIIAGEDPAAVARSEAGRG